MATAKKKTAKKASKKESRFSVQRLGQVILAAVHLAEELFPEPRSGETKKEWVVNLLNEKIDIPLLTEGMEARIIGLLIDVVCDITFIKGSIKGNRNVAMSFIDAVKK